MPTPRLTCPSRHVLCALSLGTLAIAAGCLEPAEGPSRREVLAHLADAVIVPGQARLASDAAALADKLAAVCVAYDPALHADVQAAWRAVRADWSVASAWAFGPVATQMQAGPLDFWPVRVDTIEAKIAEAPAKIDAAYIDALGTSAKGMPALEYLLFTPDFLDAPDRARRCPYASALAADIARRAEALSSAWDPAYAAALASAGDGSDIYTSEQAGLDAVVNATIENLYRMVKDKLDRPLGNLTGSDPDPEALESRFSGTTRDDLEANLRGFASVYLGADGEPGGQPGLGALVAARDPALDDRILAQHGVARDAIASVPEPFSKAIVEHRGDVQRARDEIDALRRLIKLDVASLLGVTLMLSDNDGD